MGYNICPLPFDELLISRCDARAGASHAREPAGGQPAGRLPWGPAPVPVARAPRAQRRKRLQSGSVAGAHRARRKANLFTCAMLTTTMRHLLHGHPAQGTTRAAMPQPCCRRAREPAVCTTATWLSTILSLSLPADAHRPRSGRSHAARTKHLSHHSMTGGFFPSTRLLAIRLFARPVPPPPQLHHQNSRRPIRPSCATTPWTASLPREADSAVPET